MRKSLITVVAAATAALGIGMTPGAASATDSGPSAATTSKLGTRSLASVLAADGARFDHNQWDYDILDAAVGAVLKAKPNSPVKVLTDGKVALTAFLPNDRAFARLLASVSPHHKAHGEAAVFAALAKKFGVDTIEKVLLYHVVPGKTITAKDALKAHNVKLTTAAGGTLTVKVWQNRYIRLVDADRNARDGYVIVRNINKGNRQIGHTVSQVLRLVDL